MLRQVFEQELGKPVGDRTWRRWRRRLAILDESSTRMAEDVRIAARLAKRYPRRRITLNTVKLYRDVFSRFPDREMDGWTLYQQACRALQEEFYIQNMYRWGHRLGVPFRVNRVYPPELVRVWADFLIPISVEKRHGKFDAKAS